MKKPRQITDVELPVGEMAELALRAAAFGVSSAHYIGILALSTAYGVLHPDVQEFNQRPKAGISGPEIPDGEG